MISLADKHCLIHAHREAVARCPECGQFYCRECITEHEDRVICAACLRKTVVEVVPERRSLSSLVRAAQCLFGVVILWLFFFLLGQSLLTLPASLHEGTIWNREW
jgi:hypothetical protein